MPREQLSNHSPDPLAVLAQVRQTMTQREVGERLNVAPKTVGRWERKQTECPTYVQAALREMLPVRGGGDAGDFTFIDLFAGIGGMRKGFESVGGKNKRPRRLTPRECARRVAAVMAHQILYVFQQEGLRLLCRDEFRVIRETLQKELGYHIQFKVIDGRAFTPQHRERIIIVGFKEPTGFSFDRG